MPHPMGCIDCDKPATVVDNGVYYCYRCSLKNKEKPKEDKKNG